MGTFLRIDDLDAARISPESTRDAAIAALRRPDVDGLFVSCTSLQVAPIAREVEDATGKPITSSNLAMAWHCLRLAGIDDPKPERSEENTSELQSPMRNSYAVFCLKKKKKNKRNNI